MAAFSIPSKSNNIKTDRKKSKFKISPFVIITLIICYFLGSLPMIIIGFLSVLIHELAHALAAKLCGYEILSIEILPIGAIARIDGLFEKSPASETIIAVSGPLMSLIISLVSYSLYAFYPIEIINLFMKVNLSIALFNMLPAMPLDGGRILRSALAPHLGLKKATTFSCWCGIYIGASLMSLSIVLSIKGLINPTIIPFSLLLIFSSYKEMQRASIIFIAEITDKKESLMKSGALRVRQLAVPKDMTLLTLISRFWNVHHLK